MLTGECSCPSGQAIKLGIVFRRNQRRKRANGVAFFQRQIVEYRCKRHGCTFQRGGEVRKFYAARSSLLARPSLALPIALVRAVVGRRSAEPVGLGTGLMTSLTRSGGLQTADQLRRRFGNRRSLVLRYKRPKLFCRRAFDENDILAIPG